MNASVNDGMMEVCNEVDDNCNSLVDDGLAFTNYYFDNDGDTFGNTTDAVFACEQPNGYVLTDGDCNDSNPNIGPNALEICNNIDDNCNGLIDEDLDCSTENTDSFVPTGFSPNNDGFNDTWQIPWLVNQSGYSVTVVNRWEQRVFFTNNFANGWDGTYEGERLPTADYYYVITLSDGTVLSGALTIKY
jgi:gliding motility-associated-like protein